MKDQLKITNNIQENFLTILKQNISHQLSIVDIISDTLGVSQDAAYRRLRGDKKFDIDEMYILCSKYNISIDRLFSVQSIGTVFNYSSLDINNVDNYIKYMQNLSNSIELVRQGIVKEIILSAIDIPIFHFLPFHELTLFKLFAWNSTTYNQNGDFESFIEKVSCPEIFCCYEKIASDYTQIPSTEIWTINTIDTIIRLLDFYFETGYFKRTETAIMLCNQLLSLVENIKIWVENGYKKSPSVEYKFYISDTDLENNFILLKKDSDCKCIIKLFTINSLNTSDQKFCTETLNWLETSKKRSTLLSGASERDRFRYFNILQQKVRYIIDKFEKSRHSHMSENVLNTFNKG